MSFFPKQPSSRQGATQVVAIGAASTAITNAFGSQTHQLRVSATAACYYLVSEAANVIAVTSSNGAYLPANVIEYITVTPGQKISAIEVPSGSIGNLSVTEVS